MISSIKELGNFDAKMIDLRIYLKYNMKDI